MNSRYCRRCDARLQRCATCTGKGQIYRSGMFSGGGRVRCPTCNGTGKLCPKHGDRYG